MLLRKCRICGSEAHNEEELELFHKDKKSCYSRKNLCKKCYNRLHRTRWKPARDKSHKKCSPRMIRFLGKLIYLKENPRTNICTECRRSYPDELKRQTDMHHEIYGLGNPLAYTRELCASCHTTLHNRERREKHLLMVGLKVSEISIRGTTKV